MVYIRCWSGCYPDGVSRIKQEGLTTQMKAPTLFRIVQIPLKDFVKNGFKLTVPDEEMPLYYVRQGDCALFAQIRRLTGVEWERDRVITEMLFCSLGTQMKSKDIATEVVKRGLIFNNRHFVVSERSASMKRNGFCSFIDSGLEIQINSAIEMGLPIERMEVVYSKWSAYKGLMLSGGFVID